MKVLTEARRKAIVEAASQLFQEHGYEGASMNELAARLRGSKATLYRYFPSKEALFDAVVRGSSTWHLSKAVDDLQAEHRAAEKLGIRAVLQEFGETMLRVITDAKGALAVYRMVVAEAGRSEVGELFYNAGPRQSIVALGALMQRAMDRGELLPANPEFVANCFLALVTADVQPRLFQRDPPPLSVGNIRAMVSRAVDMFMSGAASR